MKLRTRRVEVTLIGEERLYDQAARASVESRASAVALCEMADDDNPRTHVTVEFLANVQESFALVEPSIAMQRPLSGPLSRLPVTKHVEVLIEEGHGRRWRRLNWGRGASILWQCDSNHFRLLAPDESAATLWMVRYFWFNLFTCFGEISVAHASLVWFREKYLLVTAATGGGKTTAALTCHSMGGSILVDDICYFSASFRCATRPIRQFMNVRPNTRRLLKNETSDSLGNDLARERSSQEQIEMSGFRRTGLNNFSPEAQVDVVLNLVSKSEGIAGVKSISSKSMRRSLSASLPAEPIGWMMDAVKGSRIYQRSSFTPPATVRCLTAEWNILDLHGLKAILNEATSSENNTSA